MITELQLRSAILVCDILGFDNLQRACNDIAVMRAFRPDGDPIIEPPYIDDVTSSVKMLIQSGRRKYIPDVANVFKQYGLSDLLSGMQQLITEIVHAFAYVEIETTDILRLEEFRERQRQRIAKKEEWVSVGRGPERVGMVVPPQVVSEFRLSKHLLPTPELFEFAAAVRENEVLRHSLLESVATNSGNLLGRMYDEAARRNENLKEIFGIAGKVPVVVRISDEDNQLHFSGVFIIDNEEVYPRVRSLTKGFEMMRGYRGAEITIGLE